jgi:hypothetical protein
VKEIVVVPIDSLGKPGGTEGVRDGDALRAAP